MKVNNIIGIFLFLILLVGCNGKFNIGKNKRNASESDSLTTLERIQQRDTLIAVTDCSAINYISNEGRPSGFEYDLLHNLCNKLDVILDLRVNDNIDSCYKMLESGDIDILATAVGITRDNKKRFLISDPIMTQRYILVQRLPKHWHDMFTGNEIESDLLRSTLDLAQRTVYVPKSSTFVTMLHNISNEIGDTIYIVEVDSLNSVDLIQMVADGKIDYTIAEEHIAKMSAKNNPELDIKLPISFERQTGWAMRKSDNDSTLLLAVNDWLGEFNKRQLRRTFNKYFKGENNILANFKGSPINHICEYDNEIRKVAKNIGWDWRLLASLIYHESRFNEDLMSSRGAYGLMQLMPVVMDKYGIDSNSTPAEQIAAGGKLLKYIDNALPASITDSAERKMFVLAAYNSGLGHVLDARRLAEKYGRVPDTWTDNVDYFILNKSKAQYYNDTLCRNGYLRGTETYDFVENVLDRYEYYKATVKK